MQKVVMLSIITTLTACSGSNDTESSVSASTEKEGALIVMENNTLKEIESREFTTIYSFNRNTSFLAIQKISKELSPNIPKKDTFVSDAKIKQSYQPNVYAGIGYLKGRLVPIEGLNIQGKNEARYLTNAVPMSYDIYSQVWRGIERRANVLAQQSSTPVTVMTGVVGDMNTPILWDYLRKGEAQIDNKRLKTTEGRAIAIPVYLYKIIKYDKGVERYVVPNCWTDIHKIERAKVPYCLMPNQRIDIRQFLFQSKEDFEKFYKEANSRFGEEYPVYLTMVQKYQIN